MTVERIADPKGVGGVSSTYYVHQFGDTVHVGPLHGSDEEICKVAEQLAHVTGTRWDVVKEVITHETIAALWKPQSAVSTVP